VIIWKNQGKSQRERKIYWQLLFMHIIWFILYNLRSMSREALPATVSEPLENPENPIQENRRRIYRNIFCALGFLVSVWGLWSIPYANFVVRKEYREKWSDVLLDKSRDPNWTQALVASVTKRSDWIIWTPVKDSGSFYIPIQSPSWEQTKIVCSTIFEEEKLDEANPSIKAYCYLPWTTLEARK
jgi:hypothetical protein